MPRIRQNILTNEWVVVSPERAHRPEQFADRPAKANLHLKECVFCVNGPAWQGRYPEADTKHNFVIPNKYPAFVTDGALEETGHRFFTDDTSYGVHEVIILKNPQDHLNQMPISALIDLISVMQKRVFLHEQDLTIRSILPFYNHGQESGASIPHPHAQLIGNALVPPRLATEQFVCEQYFNRHHSCAVCDMAQFEMKEKSRLIVQNSDCVATAAYAPRFPFEIWVMPKHHSAAFSSATLATVQGVAQIMHEVFHRLDTKLHNPPLNWYIHTSRRVDHHLHATYHWHIEITPRLSNFGAYELGTDMVIETMLPEVAAAFLR